MTKRRLGVGAKCCVGGCDHCQPEADLDELVSSVSASFDETEEEAESPQAEDTGHEEE